MNKVNKSRIRRRKQERDEVRKIVTDYAASMGMLIIDMKNVRPETMHEAMILLCDARSELPVDRDAIIQSTNYEKHIEFVLTNIKSYVGNGCTMCKP